MSNAERRLELKAEIRKLEDQQRDLYKEIAAIDVQEKPQITLHGKFSFVGYATCTGQAGCDWKSPEYLSENDNSNAAWAHAKEVHGLERDLGTLHDKIDYGD